MVHSTFQHPPPPHTVTHCLHCTLYNVLWEGGGGGGQREGTVEGYTSIVPSSIGATVHKLGRKYKP
jgi:hypothetical protein